MTAWLSYSEAGPVPGIPGIKDTTFHINERVPATALKHNARAPIELRFRYTPPRGPGRKVLDPVQLCNAQLEKKPQRTRYQGTEIKLQAAYMTKIVVRRVTPSAPGAGFVPRRVNVVTGTPLEAVLVCRPLTPDGKPRATATEQRTQDGKQTQTVVVKPPATRAHSRSGSSKKTPSGRPIKELFKPIRVRAEGTAFTRVGNESCPSKVAMAAVVETTGMFTGSYRFTTPSGRRPLRPLNMRAPYRILLKDEARLAWRTLPPDADGTKRQKLQIAFHVLDRDGDGVTMNFEKVTIACTPLTGN